MFLFEEVISGQSTVKLLEYIDEKKSTVSCLNAQFIISVNGIIIRKEDYSSVILTPNDKITVLPLLGGG